MTSTHEADLAYSRVPRAFRDSFTSIVITICSWYSVMHEELQMRITSTPQSTTNCQHNLLLQCFDTHCLTQWITCSIKLIQNKKPSCRQDSRPYCQKLQRSRDLVHAHFHGNYLCTCSAFPIQSCLPNSKSLAQAVLEICPIVCQKLQGHVTQATPIFRENFCAPAIGIPDTKLNTKFEVSSSSSFRDIAL